MKNWRLQPPDWYILFDCVFRLGFFLYMDEKETFREKWNSFWESNTSGNVGKNWFWFSDMFWICDVGIATSKNILVI